MATSEIPGTLLRSPTDAGAAPPPESLRSSQVALVVLATMLIIVARWIWIGGTGDYGYTYELAARIFHGETQYADFITTFPPSAGYPLAGLMALTGQSLWSATVMMYLTWVLAIGAGWLLLQQLQARPTIILGSLLLAIALSLPAMVLNNSYNFLATAVAGVSAWWILRWHRDHRLHQLLLAGVMAGLCLHAKQNIGVWLAFVVVLALAYLDKPWRAPKSLARHLTIFSLGWVVGFVPLFAWFCGEAGLTEAFYQMFKDASDAKGGPLMMFYSATPRLLLSAATPHKNYVMLALSGMLAVVVLATYWIAFQRCGANQARHDDSTHRTPRKVLTTWLVVHFGLGILLAVVSLYDLPGWQAVRKAATPLPIISWTVTVRDLCYLALVSFCLIYWIKPAHHTPRRMVSSLLLAGITIGHATSNSQYVAFAAPVSIPLALVLMDEIKLMRFVGRNALIAGVLVTVCAYLFPVFMDTFVALRPLPRRSQFAGIYAPPAYHARVTELVNNISPQIENHTTLWLCPPGPHAAYGGQPVMNVPILFPDMYNSRSEKRLWDHWHQQPPDFVVWGKFQPAKGAQYLTPSSIQNWLQKHYRVVWISGDGNLSLWEKAQLIQ